MPSWSVWMGWAHPLVRPFWTSSEPRRLGSRVDPSYETRVSYGGRVRERLHIRGLHLANRLRPLGATWDRSRGPGSVRSLGSATTLSRKRCSRAKPEDAVP